jgi:hypothetical protein
MAQPRIGREIYNREPSPDPEPVVEAPTQPVLGPEENAKALMQYLPEHVQQIMTEVHTTLKQPLWCLLLGYTMKVADWGELFAPRILGEWSAELPAKTDRICQQCGTIFISPVPEGMYCCSRCYFGKVATLGHSDDCLIPHVAVQVAPVEEPDEEAAI